jgi:hypothetical protein
MKKARQPDWIKRKPVVCAITGKRWKEGDRGWWLVRTGRERLFWRCEPFRGQIVLHTRLSAAPSLLRICSEYGQPRGKAKQKSQRKRLARSKWVSVRPKWGDAAFLATALQRLPCVIPAFPVSAGGLKMDKQRKYAILLAATILAARKLSDHDLKAWPRAAAIREAIQKAEQILEEIEQRGPTKTN